MLDKSKPYGVLSGSMAGYEQDGKLYFLNGLPMKPKEPKPEEKVEAPVVVKKASPAVLGSRKTRSRR